METLALAARADSPDKDLNLVQTSAQVHTEETAAFNEQDDIPYHARQYAQPFTYGNLPEGFTNSELNHVEIEEREPARNPVLGQTALPPSPSVLRKNARPSISPSRPVLRKTPSRKEFEEMLAERKEQSLREHNNTATKLAQNAAIQKDLDELQEKLNKKVAFKQIAHTEDNTTSQNLPVVAKNTKNTIKTLRTVDLPDATHVDTAKLDSQIIPVDNTDSSPIRAETPAFPAEPKTANGRCVSPYPAVTPPMSATPADQTVSIGIRSQQSDDANNHILLRQPSEPHLVEPHLVKFARDSSEFWYKPHITREEAIALLRNAEPGTFLIRNSTTYKNAYGLVLRVAKPPLGVVVPQGSNGDELVRHFLLEPSTRGVRLKGCANEPLFTSLSALVYEHSINQLALPCKLSIPEQDILHSSGDAALIAEQKQLLRQGAACNVLYLFTCNTESLTGDEAVRRAVYEMYAQRPLPKPVEVHFKVSQAGITLTDNTRTRFFRRHYAASNISHCGIDPDNRFWSVTAQDEDLERVVNKMIFAFVARPLTGGRDNECLVFCDLAYTQPASAIVSFANKVLPMDKRNHRML